MTPFDKIREALSYYDRKKRIDKLDSAKKVDDSVLPHKIRFNAEEHLNHVANTIKFIVNRANNANTPSRTEPIYNIPNTIVNMATL